MSGLVDGVNKYFLMYHELGSMHCDTYKSLRGLLRQCLRQEIKWNDLDGSEKRLNEIKGEIDKLIDEMKVEAEAACSKDNPCCERMDEYNGFGSDAALSFTCPKSCMCHD